MKIRFRNSPVAVNSGEGETILLACARSGIILSAPCGGRGHCGKCTVQLIEGQVTGDIYDGGMQGTNIMVRACAAVPVSDITIALDESSILAGGEIAAPCLSSRNLDHYIRNGVACAGIALDIGTTTVSARLVDLETSLALDTVSELNDQRAFGADVMSRIGAAMNGKTAELHKLINHQTERMIRSFRERWNIRRIKKLSVSGNTAMLHFFLNADPSGLGALPFTPVFLEEKEMKGEVLSLPVETITILPSIAAFIGGDITAGLGALDILNMEGPSLLVDIGTNGEMALAHKGTIYCCSTAAGPAFEGVEISNGMGGVSGAISGVELNAVSSNAASIDARTSYSAKNSISLTTIGNVPPKGICGSGLIDAVAVMLELGVIDDTGLMTGGEKSFYLAPGVYVTNRDVRQFQLAKSAILSGIKILCRNAGLGTPDIRNVFIAGGFGFFINRKNAGAAGIFPEEFIEPMVISGNLSLKGAEENLSAEDFMDRCKKIIRSCSVIDLAGDPSFADEFAENMLFKQKEL